MFRFAATLLFQNEEQDHDSLATVAIAGSYWYSFITDRPVDTVLALLRAGK